MSLFFLTLPLSGKKRPARFPAESQSAKVERHITLNLHSAYHRPITRAGSKKICHRRSESEAPTNETTDVAAAAHLLLRAPSLYFSVPACVPLLPAMIFARLPMHSSELSRCSYEARKDSRRVREIDSAMELKRTCWETALIPLEVWDREQPVDPPSVHASSKIWIRVSTGSFCMLERSLYRSMCQ